MTLRDTSKTTTREQEELSFCFKHYNYHFLPSDFESLLQSHRKYCSKCIKDIDTFQTFLQVEKITVPSFVSSIGSQALKFHLMSLLH